MGRWKEFMEHGPDKLDTDESEEYEPDSADEAMIAVEMKKEEVDDGLESHIMCMTKKQLMLVNPLKQ